jgi:hypothetical protein
MSTIFANAAIGDRLATKAALNAAEKGKGIKPQNSHSAARNDVCA